MRYEEYSTRYQHVRMKREEGIIELQLHSDGGPLIWGAGPHSELGACFSDVAHDSENRIVILTGTGDRFIDKVDMSWVGAMTPEKWYKIYFDGKRLIDELLGIEVPVISAINGPARVHSEIALLADICLAADHAVFQDAPHFRRDTVPGDGVQAIWPLLLGPNRARYFLLTGQRILAQEALALGVVSELLPLEGLLERAYVLARLLCQQSDTTLRFTRVALTDTLRRAMRDSVGYGLALEGLNAHATWPNE
jgi:enoyl-CoA hydratase/carnithine racemase